MLHVVRRHYMEIFFKESGEPDSETDYLGYLQRFDKNEKEHNILLYNSDKKPSSNKKLFPKEVNVQKFIGLGKMIRSVLKNLTRLKVLTLTDRPEGQRQKKEVGNYASEYNDKENDSRDLRREQILNCLKFMTNIYNDQVAKPSANDPPLNVLWTRHCERIHCLTTTGQTGIVNIREHQYIEIQHFLLVACTGGSFKFLSTHSQGEKQRDTELTFGRFKVVHDKMSLKHWKGLEKAQRRATSLRLYATEPSQLFYVRDGEGNSEDRRILSAASSIHSLTDEQFRRKRRELLHADFETPHLHEAFEEENGLEERHVHNVHSGAGSAPTNPSGKELSRIELSRAAARIAYGLPEGNPLYWNKKERKQAEALA